MQPANGKAPRTKNVIPFFLNGTLFGPQYVLPPPGLQFLSAIVWPRDIEIQGYEFGFQGLSTFTGPLIPGMGVPFPIFTIIVIGTASPTFSINNPIVGTAITQILCGIDGGNAYIPANAMAVPARPETVSQTNVISETFQDGFAIKVPANSPISLYGSLSNNSIFDLLNADAVIYATEVQP